MRGVIKPKFIKYADRHNTAFNEVLYDYFFYNLKFMDEGYQMVEASCPLVLTPFTSGTEIDTVGASQVGAYLFTI